MVGSAKMKPFTLAFAILSTSAALTSGCSSSSSGNSGGNSLGEYSCGGGTTSSGCNVSCSAESVDWSAECDTSVPGKVTCTCTTGPKQGTSFEEPTACELGNGFDAREQCV